MKLWLDGRFWGPWIRQEFVQEIEWTRRVVLDHMLASIPSAEVEGKRAEEEAWEAMMSRPSDGSTDHGECAELAQEQGLDVYMRLKSVCQAARNMTTVMLWHLLEQQMLHFHMRQILESGEEQDFLQDIKQRDKRFGLEEFHRRLDEGGCSMKCCPSWSKIEELQLLANAVKHGRGASLVRLYAVRPDLLEMPGMPPLSPGMEPKPSEVEKPAAGDGLYVSHADIVAYFDAAIRLWKEFSVQIEKHSAR